MSARSTSRGGAAVHRRSRSLSRFPPPTPGSDEFETPRGRFVNKTRGSGQVLFPESGEVSLDDLADEFLRARAESEEDETVLVRRGRDKRRMSLFSGNSSSGSSVRYLRETEASKQRGRSVSRPPAVGRNQSVGTTRTRYSSIVDRRRGTRSNSEVERDVSQDYNPKHTNKKPSMGGKNLVQKQPNSTRAMRRSASQKDFFHSHDSSSTHSSLTDDDAKDAGFIHINRNEKTIREVYSPEKEQQGNEEETGLYKAMRKEVRNAVEEIRTQLEKVVVKTEPTADRTGGDDVKPVQVIAELRRNYSSKLDESEKRKQVLLAELAAEEQRGQELTKIVKELLPSPQSNKERHSRARRRSKERSRVSRHLIEEAERYFEDFLSNVDDTDFSSFDGERSDTSSCRKDFLSNPTTNSTLIEFQETPVTKSSPLSFETDGVVLPWLQWETSLQSSPLKTKPEAGSARTHHVTSSSHASWSPEYGSGSDASVCRSKSTSNFEQVKAYRVDGLVGKIKSSSFFKDEYLDLRNKEDFLLERLRQRERIESGSLLLCERIMF